MLTHTSSSYSILLYRARCAFDYGHSSIFPAVSSRCCQCNAASSLGMPCFHPFTFREGCLFAHFPAKGSTSHTRPPSLGSFTWGSTSMPREQLASGFVLCSLQARTAKQFGLSCVLLGCSPLCAGPDNLPLPSHCREEVCLLVCFALLLGWLWFWNHEVSWENESMRLAFLRGSLNWVELSYPGTCGKICDTSTGKTTRWLVLGDLELRGALHCKGGLCSRKPCFAALCLFPFFSF